MPVPFSYDKAFDRNIGWLTVAEQQALRGRRVAIAGCGGVGGVHLLTLTRLGIGAFTLADHDVFELANFNRQAGATMASLGRSKVEVMAAFAREINPELDLRVLDEGVGRSCSSTASTSTPSTSAAAPSPPPTRAVSRRSPPGPLGSPPPISSSVRAR